MFQEAAESASAVERQLKENHHKMLELVKVLRFMAPNVIVTCARGSSDHAATYGKYLFETLIGVVTSSSAPSVSSIYDASQRMGNALFIAISQSGKSPDLISQTKAAKKAGAMVVALVNVEDSPLAAIADVVLPLYAGAELSVAATKSYICSLSALLQLAAYWSGDSNLLKALDSLPEMLRRSWKLDWSPAVEALLGERNLFVNGRGYGFGVALEAALKFKETCGLHAEALSAAEVMHGPMAIVGKGFPVLLFGQNDKTRGGIDDLAKEFSSRGAKVMLAAEGGETQWRLPVVAGAHPVCSPLLSIQSFYRMVNELSLARGFDPDLPPHLNKVTKTV